MPQIDWYSRTPPRRRRSRRLDKKLRLGAFTQWGFRVHIALVDGIGVDPQLDFWGDFIEAVIEPRDLAFGGGEERGYVTGSAGRSASDADRDAVARWLPADPRVARVEVQPLSNAWYGQC